MRNIVIKLVANTAATRPHSGFAARFAGHMLAGHAVHRVQDEAPRCSKLLPGSITHRVASNVRHMNTQRAEAEHPTTADDGARVLTISQADLVISSRRHVWISYPPATPTPSFRGLGRPAG